MVRACLRVKFCWRSVSGVSFMSITCWSPAQSKGQLYRGQLIRLQMWPWQGEPIILQFSPCGASRRCPRLYYARNPRKALELASEATQAADFKERWEIATELSIFLFFFCQIMSHIGQWMIQSGFPPKSGMWMRRSKNCCQLAVGIFHPVTCRGLVVESAVGQGLLSARYLGSACHATTCHKLLQLDPSRPVSLPDTHRDTGFVLDLLIFGRV